MNIYFVISYCVIFFSELTYFLYIIKCITGNAFNGSKFVLFQRIDATDGAIALLSKSNVCAISFILSYIII
jgi:hypothetical protein